MKTGNAIRLIIAGTICLILQLLLAPGISIGYAMPNFIAAFCVAQSAASPEDPSHLYAFVFGLAYNLVSNGPVGSMAICLLITTFLLTHARILMDTSNFIMGVVACAIGALMVNVLYAVTLSMLTDGVAMGAALLYRALPCAAYDIVLSVLLFVVLKIIVRGKPQSGPKSAYNL